MHLTATNLNLPFNASESALLLLLAGELRLSPSDITNLRIVRRSLDARDKGDIRFVYNVVFDITTEKARRVAALELKNVGRLPEYSPEQVKIGDKPQAAPVVVIGFRPAGIFA